MAAVDLIDPNIDLGVRIPYHTMEPAMLAMITREGLLQAGVPNWLLSWTPGASKVISALWLSEHARESLPPELGGPEEWAIAGHDTLLRSTLGSGARDSAGALTIPPFDGVSAALLAEARAVEEAADGDREMAARRKGVGRAEMELARAARTGVPGSLSPPAGGGPRPLRSTLFTASVRPAPREELQHAAAAAQMYRVGAEARAVLSKAAGLFRLTRDAMWAQEGWAPATPAVLSDHVWLEAARAQLGQLRAWEILRESAAAEVGSDNLTAQRAKALLGEGLDLYLAGMIRHGGLTVTMSPLERHVG